jgi:hypothetical protein
MAEKPEDENVMIAVLLVIVLAGLVVSFVLGSMTCG